VIIASVAAERSIRPRASTSCTRSASAGSSRAVVVSITGHEVLEAYVEGRLSAGEREMVEGLAASSRIVAEDIAGRRNTVMFTRRGIVWGIFWGSAILMSTAALVYAFNPQPDPPGHYYGLMTINPGQHVSVHVSNTKASVNTKRPGCDPPGLRPGK
jgi:hypothetical protein